MYTYVFLGIYFDIIVSYFSFSIFSQKWNLSILSDSNHGDLNKNILLHARFLIFKILFYFIEIILAHLHVS